VVFLWVCVFVFFYWRRFFIFFFFYGFSVGCFEFYAGRCLDCEAVVLGLFCVVLWFFGVGVWLVLVRSVFFVGVICLWGVAGFFCGVLCLFFVVFFCWGFLVFLFCFVVVRRVTVLFSFFFCDGAVGFFFCFSRGLLGLCGFFWWFVRGFAFLGRCRVGAFFCWFVFFFFFFFGVFALVGLFTFALPFSLFTQHRRESYPGEPHISFLEPPDPSPASHQALFSDGSVLVETITRRSHGFGPRCALFPTFWNGQPPPLTTGRR